MTARHGVVYAEVYRCPERPVRLYRVLGFVAGRRVFRDLVEATCGDEARLVAERHCAGRVTVTSFSVHRR